MNQEACVTDSSEDLCWRGWGREAGQQVPGAATEMAPSAQKTGLAATEVSGQQTAGSWGQRSVGVCSVTLSGWLPLASCLNVFR